MINSKSGHYDCCWFILVFLIMYLLISYGISHCQGPPIVFGRTDPPINLLENSGFSAWSFSELAQGTTGRQTSYESYKIQEDDFTTDTSGDYTKTDCTMTHTIGGGVGGTNYMIVTETNPTQTVSLTLSGLSVDHNYKFSIYVINGTYTLATTDTISAYNNAGTELLAETPLADSAAWSDFSVIFRATETNNQVLITLGMGAGQTIGIDDWYVCEVHPGIISATNNAFDYWYKDTTLDIYQELYHAVQDTGIYYGLKCAPTAADDYIYFPKGKWDKNYWIEEFEGKTVSCGCWARTATASHFSIEITAGTTTTSAYHTGGDDFEWIYVTKKIATSSSGFYILFRFAQASGVVYITRPILVYGDTAPQDHYYQPEDEIIFFEQEIASHNLSNHTGLSTVAAWTTIYPQSDSTCVIPLNAKALLIRNACSDSGSLANTAALFLSSNGSAADVVLPNALTGLANNAYGYSFGDLPLDTDGTFRYKLTASGANAFDIDGFYYVGVILK